MPTCVLISSGANPERTFSFRLWNIPPIYKVKKDLSRYSLISIVAGEKKARRGIVLEIQFWCQINHEQPEEGEQKKKESPKARIGFERISCPEGEQTLTSIEISFDSVHLNVVIARPSASLKNLWNRWKFGKSRTQPVRNGENSRHAPAWKPYFIRIDKRHRKFN